MPAVMEIVNRALGHLGSQPLTSLDEATPLAAKIKVFWPQARDDVLRAHTWVCCRKRARLPRLAEDPPFGFAAQFQLPEDFLRLVATDPAGATVAVEGNRLLADQAVLAIVYVRREEDAALYDPQLCGVLALKLATELAYGITGSTSLAQSLAGRCDAALSEARGNSARESEARPGRTSAWVAAKFGR